MMMIMNASCHFHDYYHEVNDILYISLLLNRCISAEVVPLLSESSLYSSTGLHSPVLFTLVGKQK